MTDDVIIRLATEACEALSDMEFWMGCDSFVPTYNGLVQAAKANHPEHDFIAALDVIPPRTPAPPPAASEGLNVFERMWDTMAGKFEGQSIPPAQLKFLFAQLRILLDASQSEVRPES
jgi:hypothetical protein